MCSTTQSDTAYDINEVLNRKPKKGFGFIYLYVFDDGKMYIGQTIQRLKRRHLKHCIDTSNTICDNYIQSCKHEYKIYILEEVSINQLSERECFYVLKYNTLSPIGLNLIMPIPGDVYFCSEETRAKISNKTKGRVRTKDCIEKQSESLKEHWNKYKDHPWIGKHHSVESKMKMSESTKGVSWGKHTEEWKSQQSERVMGDKNPMFGKHRSEEAKRKHSETYRLKREKKLQEYLDWEWMMTLKQ